VENVLDIVLWGVFGVVSLGVIALAAIVLAVALMSHRAYAEEGRLWQQLQDSGRPLQGVAVSLVRSPSGYSRRGPIGQRMTAVQLGVAYVDAAAYDCLARRLDREGHAIDRGLAPLQLFVRMKKVADTIGPRQSLAGTTRPVRLTDPALRVVVHKRQDQYAIYGVPRAMAERMSCASEAAFGRLPPIANTRASREVYENFYSTVAIDRADRARAALGLLWQRRDGLWKIVSYQEVWEDAPTSAAMPDLRSPIAPASLSTMTAIPSSSRRVSASSRHGWFARTTMRRRR